MRATSFSSELWRLIVSQISSRGAQDLFLECLCLGLHLLECTIPAQPNRMKDLILKRVNAVELGHLSLTLIVVLVCLGYGELIHHIHEALRGLRGGDPLRHHHALGGRWLLPTALHLLICILLATLGVAVRMGIIKFHFISFIVQSPFCRCLNGGHEWVTLGTRYLGLHLLRKLLGMTVE
jgi:hypothetical protein